MQDRHVGARKLSKPLQLSVGAPSLPLSLALSLVLPLLHALTSAAKRVETPNRLQELFFIVEVSAWDMVFGNSTWASWSCVKSSNTRSKPLLVAALARGRVLSRRRGHDERLWSTP